LSSRAPDKYIRPVITFVIFASGLKYAGLGTTALGWTLCLVLLACGGYWLARNKPWRRAAPADDTVRAAKADETVRSELAHRTGLCVALAGSAVRARSTGPAGAVGGG
jgi:hypothetical protein